MAKLKHSACAVLYLWLHKHIACLGGKVTESTNTKGSLGEASSFSSPVLRHNKAVLVSVGIFAAGL